jgi:hypothetical protein
MPLIYLPPMLLKYENKNGPHKRDSSKNNVPKYFFCNGI